jgi:hypothetical protein
MKVIKSKRGVALLAVLVVAAIAAFGAYAYWTTTGNGTGSATTGTDHGVTVNQTSPSSGLYPGGSVALSGNFTSNPANSGNVWVTSVSASIDPFSVQANLSEPACTDADFFLSGSAPVGQDITPGAANGSWSGISLNMTNAAANQDNCKNVTVPLSFTSN